MGAKFLRHHFLHLDFPVSARREAFMWLQSTKQEGQWKKLLDQAQREWTLSNWSSSIVESNFVCHFFSTPHRVIMCVILLLFRYFVAYSIHFSLCLFLRMISISVQSFTSSKNSELEFYFDVCETSNCVTLSATVLELWRKTEKWIPLAGLERSLRMWKLRDVLAPQRWNLVMLPHVSHVTVFPCGQFPSSPLILVRGSPHGFLSV